MTMVSPDDGRPSISRTTRYKKVTKPLLERKRRARINRCLDELKDLMVGALEVEGDNISKLEKADILELTVRHLTKLHSPRDPIADAKRFQAGFGQCAAEACQFILSMPEIDQQIGQNLVKHLTSQIAEVPLSIQVPPRQTFSPPVSPATRSVWSSPEARDPPQSLNDSYSHASSPSESHASYGRREPPHVPLMCDTAGINSTPTVQDLSRPMTGLLMTVDEPMLQNHYSNQPHNYRNDNYVSDEAKKRHDAEVKHVIMKRIREQILGRQTKESEVKDSVSSTSYEPNLNENPYMYRNNYSYEGPSTTMDLKKRSKGESKHYSPHFESAHSNHNVEYERNAQYEATAINYSMNRNKPDAYPNTSKAYKSDHSDAESIPDSYTVRKRQADYRNIHPKKILIRPMQNEVSSSYKPEQKVYTGREEIPQQSSLRQQRLANIRNSEYANEANLSRPRSYQSTYQNVQSMDGSGSSRNPPADNDQEDNMWRPW